MVLPSQNRLLTNGIGYNDEQVNDYYAQMSKKQPLGGVIEPEQIANAAIMLASDKNTLRIIFATLPSLCNMELTSLQY